VIYRGRDKGREAEQRRERQNMRYGGKRHRGEHGHENEK
jgi:hypothetical protein